MTDFTPREKELLHMLFSPKSIEELKELFPETTDIEWESLYSNLLKHAPEKTNLVMYVDGASDESTKSAGIGGVFYRADEEGEEEAELFTFSENIGEATNNEAEYTALIKALEYAQQLNGGHLAVYSDSELMVKQLNLEFKVKNKRILKLYVSATKRLNEFDSWKVRHVPRAGNKKADILSKQALLNEKEGAP